MRDSGIVDVIFRVVKSGDFRGTVEAWFPGLPGSSAHDVTVYAHVGQHSAGDLSHMRQRTRPALPREYADLKSELESIGYRLRVVRKATAKHAVQRRAAMVSMAGGKRRHTSARRKRDTSKVSGRIQHAVNELRGLMR